MDLKKLNSLCLNPAKNNKKPVQNKLSLPSNNNSNDKKKSDDFDLNQILTKYKSNNKLNKIPVNPRMNHQDKNKLISNAMKQHNDEEKVPQEKDQNNFLNILNDIYHEPHLSNKNILSKYNFDPSSNILKTYSKMKSLNFSNKKMKLKDNSAKKARKMKTKKLSCSSQSTFKDGYFKCVKKLSYINSIMDDMNDKNKKQGPDGLEQEYKSSKGIINLLDESENNNINTNNINFSKSNKFKSSYSLTKKFVKDENSKEMSNYKSENNNKDCKKIKKWKKKKSHNADKDKEEVETQKGDTKNNSNKNIIQNKNYSSKKNNVYIHRVNKEEKNKGKKKRKIKFCLFCCFKSKDDSLSENE